MPLATTHFIATVVLITLFRDFFIKDKKKFPVHYVFIGGLAGLLPDVDIAFYWFYYFFGVEFISFSHNLSFLSGSAPSL